MCTAINDMLDPVIVHKWLNQYLAILGQIKRLFMHSMEHAMIARDK
jgi:Zn-dependent protease